MKPIRLLCDADCRYDGAADEGVVAGSRSLVGRATAGVRENASALTPNPLTPGTYRIIDPRDGDGVPGERVRRRAASSAV